MISDKLPEVDFKGRRILCYKFIRVAWNPYKFLH